MWASVVTLLTSVLYLIVCGNAQEAVTKDFLLRNHSVVPVSYKLIRENHDCDSAFTVTPTEGVLAHQSEIRVSVTYKPQAFGTFSCERYSFITPGTCI